MRRRRLVMEEHGGERAGRSRPTTLGERGGGRRAGRAQRPRRAPAHAGAGARRRGRPPATDGQAAARRRRRRPTAPAARAADAARDGAAARAAEPRRRRRRRRSGRRPTPHGDAPADGAGARRRPTGVGQQHRRAGVAEVQAKAEAPAAAQEAREALEHGMVVWVMMGIAVWHFTVFVPDRFWGGIVGAFLAAIAGGRDVRLHRERLHRARARTTRSSIQALIAIPGAMIGLAVSYFYGAARGPRGRRRPRAHARGLAPLARMTGATARPFRRGAVPEWRRMEARVRRGGRAHPMRSAGAAAARARARRLRHGRRPCWPGAGSRDPEEARALPGRASERHDPRALPGLPGRLRADPRPPRARLADRGPRRLRRGRRLLHRDPAPDALRALGADPDVGAPEPLRRRATACPRPRGRAAGRPRGAACWSPSTAGSPPSAEVAAARAAGIDVRRHRPPPARRRAARLHRRASRRSATTAAPSCARPAWRSSSREALRAAAGRDPAEADEDLDLAALATVCDLVPLRGENRRIVREGLAALARTRRPGLRALMEVAARGPGRRLPSTRSASGSGRGSTPPGGCSAPTPRSSCCSPRTRLAPARWRASSTC